MEHFNKDKIQNEIAILLSSPQTENMSVIELKNFVIQEFSKSCLNSILKSNSDLKKEFEQLTINTKNNFNNVEISNESLSKSINILKNFEKIPQQKYEDTDFANGEYYIKHIPEKIENALQLFVSFSKEIYKDQNIVKVLDQINTADRLKLHNIFSWLDRMDFGSGNSIEHKILKAVSQKLGKINYSNFCEYGQPFFTQNPNECKPFCINPESQILWDKEKIKSSLKVRKNKEKNIFKI